MARCTEVSGITEILVTTEPPATPVLFNLLFSRVSVGSHATRAEFVHDLPARRLDWLKKSAAAADGWRFAGFAGFAQRLMHFSAPGGR